MGACCAAASPYSLAQMKGEIDLPEANMKEINDKLRRFEHSFPLYRLHIKALHAKLKQRFKGKTNVRLEDMK